MNLGTIVRALFTTLQIEAGRSLFVQGAAGAIDRRDQLWSSAYAVVPGTAERIAAREHAGEPVLDELRRQNDGRLVDYVVSHAGQDSLPRSFQLLADGGTLAFYGATSGYWF